MVQLARAIIFSILIALNSIQVEAASIKKKQINGFEVSFIDTEKGDKVLIQYHVNVGSKMDPPEVAGRAHFLEHMVGKGSLKYPGYHTLKEEVSAIGGERNAMTSLGRTLYYTIVKEDKIEKAIDLHFGGLAGPEFNQSVLKNELQAVDDEVNVQGAKSTGKGLFMASSKELLPEGHYFQRYDLGESNVLERMSLDDLKNLFYANYTSEFVKVTIAGNFSNGNISVEEMESYLEKSLIQANIKNDKTGFKLTESPLANANLPSTYQDGQEPFPFLTLSTEDGNKVMMALFETQTPRSELNLLAIDLLSEYLDIDAPGSVKRYLEREKKWVTGYGIGMLPVADKLYMYLQVSFTDEGFNNKEEVVGEIYEAIKTVELRGIDNYTLDILKKKSVLSLNAAYENVNNVVSLHGDIEDLENELLSDFKFQEAFDNVSVADIQRQIPLILDPKFAQTTFMHPDYRGEKKELWGRYVGKESSGQALAKWDEIRSKQSSSLRFYVKLDKMNLKGREKPLNRPNTKLTKISNNRSEFETWLAEDHSSLEGAFVITTGLAAKTLEDKINMKLLVSAFIEENITELKVLHSFGVQLAVSFSEDSLSWHGKGPALAVTKAMKYFAEKFKSFEPTEDSLSRQHYKLKESVISGYSEGFIATAAISALITELKGEESSLEFIEAVKRHTVSIDKRWRKKLKATYRPIMVVKGDFSPKDLTSLRKSFKGSLAGFAPFIKQEKTVLPPAVIKNSTIRLDLPPGKDESSSGLARAYMGPSIENIREFAASLVLGQFLQEATFNLNRSERGLGYVHGAGSIYLSHSRSRLHIFYGQAENSKKHQLTIQGWEEIIENLKNRAYSDDIFYNYINSVVVNYIRQPVDHLEEVVQVLGDRLDLGSTSKRRQIVEVLKTLTPADIYQVADKYLVGNDNFVQLEFRNSECVESLLK